MKILLTGFEPFGGCRINPSEQVVRAIAQMNPAASGSSICTAVLPVDRVQGPAALVRAFDLHQPDAVLCLGEASRRPAVSIERVAINLLDYQIKDNSGHQVVDEPIVRGAPAAYFCTLPVRAMLNAVRACGVPAELSLSAGAFLCNQVTYALLHYLAQNGLQTPAGFVHLPALPEQIVDASPPMPSMSAETMLKGVQAAITAVESMKERHA